MNIFRNVARADERVHRCGCVLNSEGFFIIAIKASTTSFKLCGGMLVAIPTAIPVLPFKIRKGN